MEQQDKAEFGRALKTAMNIYQEAMTVEQLDAWWGLMQPYDLRAFRWALGHWATNPDKGRFKPLPADIIGAITVEMPKVAASRRAERIRAARDEAGPLEDELLMLETDVRNGVKTAEEVAGRVAECRARVAMIKRRAGIDDRPRMLQRGLSSLESMVLEHERNLSGGALQLAMVIEGAIGDG